MNHYLNQTTERFKATVQAQQRRIANCRHSEKTPANYPALWYCKKCGKLELVKS